MIMNTDFKDILLPNYRYCFVCGHENPRGLQKRFYVRNGHVFTEFITESWMIGYAETIHGGIVSTLLDEIIIWAAYEATGKFGATAELNVRFKRPLTVDQTYIVEGWFDEDKGKIWTAFAHIKNSESQIMARAAGKIFPFSEEINRTFCEAIEKSGYRKPS